VQEAAQRGLLSMTKLDNGQLEIGLPQAATITESRALPAIFEPLELSQVTEHAVASADGVVRGERDTSDVGEEKEREERGRRGRRGRGRGRGREREPREERTRPLEAATPSADLPPRLVLAEERTAPAAGESIGTGGERL